MTVDLSKRNVSAVHVGAGSSVEEAKEDGRLYLSNGNVRFLASEDKLLVRSCKNCCKDFVATLDSLEPSQAGNTVDFCSVECELSCSFRSDPLEAWSPRSQKKERSQDVSQPIAVNRKA